MLIKEGFSSNIHLLPVVTDSTKHNLLIGNLNA